MDAPGAGRAPFRPRRRVAKSVGPSPPKRRRKSNSGKPRGGARVKRGGMALSKRRGQAARAAAAAGRAKRAATYLDAVVVNSSALATLDRAQRVRQRTWRASMARRVEARANRAIDATVAARLEASVLARAREEAARLVKEQRLTASLMWQAKAPEERRQCAVLVFMGVGTLSSRGRGP